MTLCRLLKEYSFNLLLILLPINLGLHFINSSAYVGGLLVDYLIPTVFVQDFLAVLLIICWFATDYNAFWATLASKRHMAEILFLFTLFLSTLLSPRFIPSLYLFLRFMLYVFVSLYVSHKFREIAFQKTLVRLVAVWAVLLGLLGVFQYIKQGAIFNNYLFFGEQPYSVAVPQIAKENVLGFTRVPAYGLFSHPNVFGGILALFIVLLFYGYKTRLLAKNIFVPAVILALVSLVLTFSYVAWISCVSGLLLYYFETKRIQKRILVLFILLFVFCGIFLSKIPFSSTALENPSLSKRIELLDGGYNLWRKSPLFGNGLNSTTLLIENAIPQTRYLRFVQPTHNIFVLLLAETGVIGLLIFLFIYFRALHYSYYSNYVLFVLLVQLLILGSFDHYVLTIHQPFFVLWLLLGLAV